MQLPKEYGNKPEQEYVNWFLPMAKAMYDALADDGSLVLNLGGAYQKGRPTRSLYQYRLLLALADEIGFYLAQEFFWFNNAKLPAPAEWVTVRRIRVKDSVENLFWLSKTPYPKADNRQVLIAYSESMKQVLKDGWKAQVRPSGHKLTDFSTDNGGAIPPNLIMAANTASNTRYLRGCRQKGIKPHPARFPEEIPEFFIKFLTEEGDIVWDPFAGSNTTGAVCTRLNRKWIASEKSLTYLLGSSEQFEQSMLRGYYLGA